MLSPQRIHRSILSSVGGKSQSHDCVGVGSFSLVLIHASIFYFQYSVLTHPSTGRAKARRLSHPLDGGGCAGLQCVAFPGTLAVIMLSPQRIHRCIFSSVGGKSQSHDCVGVGSFSLVLIHASIFYFQYSVLTHPSTDWQASRLSQALERIASLTSRSASIVHPAAISPAALFPTGTCCCSTIAMQRLVAASHARKANVFSYSPPPARQYCP